LGQHFKKTFRKIWLSLGKGKRIDSRYWLERTSFPTWSASRSELPRSVLALKVRQPKPRTKNTANAPAEGTYPLNPAHGNYLIFIIFTFLTHRTKSNLLEPLDGL